MHKPIEQQTTQRPGPTESQSPKPGFSGSQPISKADPKPAVNDNIHQAPAKGTRAEQPNRVREAVKAPLGAARGDDERMSQGPKQS